VAPGSPSKIDEQDATDENDHGVGDKIINLNDPAEAAQRDRESDNGDTGPARTHITSIHRDVFELAQKQNRRKHRDQGAVAVLRR
jgi:hypothetical protein